MSKGKIIKTEFFVYLNKELYRIVHSWEELEAAENEIFTKYPGYNLLYGSTEDFSVYINKKTKDVLTYWFKIKRTTNLKDSQGNVVCIDDELVDPTGHKCWLLCSDELYIRFNHWLSSAKGRPDITDVQDLSKFTITKRHSIF